LTIVAIAVCITIVVQTFRATEQHKADEQALAQACAKPAPDHFRKPAHCFIRTDESTVYGPRI
ncbi:hypothetical protein QVM62_30730, partial [Pseudomonas putida]|uniref:hypothetical protein n=1 Tax=Pseudomonas putida TaxID=303 RepID=UPI0035238E68